MKVEILRERCPLCIGPMVEIPDEIVAQIGREIAVEDKAIVPTKSCLICGNAFDITANYLGDSRKFREFQKSKMKELLEFIRDEMKQPKIE